MDINVGDKVQIRNGGIDVTNGFIAKSGYMYAEGGPLRATVELIDNNWETGGRWNLPNIVTKVRCKALDGTIVWQVQPDDIASNIIRANVPVQKTPPDALPKVELTQSGISDLNVVDSNTTTTAVNTTQNLYTTTPSAQSWVSGVSTKGSTTGQLPASKPFKTQSISGSSIGGGTVFKY